MSVKVVKGAALLDQKVKLWYEKIDVKNLSMHTNEECILGQLFTDPWKGLKKLGLASSELGEENAIAHGFMPSSPTPSTMRTQGKALGAAWKKEINKRLKKG